MVNKALQIQDARLSKFKQHEIVIIPKDRLLKPIESCKLTGYDLDYIYTESLEGGPDSAKKTPWDQINTVLTGDYSQHLI